MLRARDVLAGRVPVVLHEAVYVLAAVVGAIVVAVVGTDRTGRAILIGTAAKVIVRLVTRWRSWEVPASPRDVELRSGPLCVRDE